MLASSSTRTRCTPANLGGECGGVRVIVALLVNEDLGQEKPPATELKSHVPAHGTYADVFRLPLHKRVHVHNIS